MTKKETLLTCLWILVAALSFIGGCQYNKDHGSKTQYIDPRSYQIETYEDSTVVFDADKRVGSIKYDSTSELDKLITNDNQ